MNKNKTYLIKFNKEKKGSEFMKNIKKNQIVIYVIALMLVAAGYLSYNINQETIEVSAQNKKDENIGEATFVNSSDVEKNLGQENGQAQESSISDEENMDDNEIETSTEVEDEYFANSKLERNRMYSQTIETYQNILDSSNSSEEQKSIATQEITDINNTQNAIMVCENLIALKGISNSVVFVNGDSVSVVVEADELGQDLVAQIQNIITRELNVSAENIHIMNK